MLNHVVATMFHVGDLMQLMDVTVNASNLSNSMIIVVDTLTRHGNMGQEDKKTKITASAVVHSGQSTVKRSIIAVAFGDEKTQFPPYGPSAALK